jgi:hypothetical protein
MDIRMKKVFLFIGIGLTLLAIPATVFFIGQQKDIRTRAAPASTLSLTPATQTVNIGDTLKLDVDIDPGTNQVVSANIYLSYDSSKLEAQTITNGSNAPRVLTSGIIENGTASIKVGAASTTQPITARGTIAVITFTAKGVTGNFSPAQVQFASNTFVGGIDETTANVLVGTVPAKITINNPNTNTTGTNFASESAGLALATTPTDTPTITVTPTLTITPTLTPTIAASDSANASASALQIFAPTDDNATATAQPVIRGTAPPGSTVTIVIHSDTAQTVTVTADANGNWVYTPTTPLDSGPHTIVASAQNTDGTTQTTTATFVVAGAGEAGASESAIPISGNVETTLVLLIAGILLIASGIVIPVITK